MPPFSEVFLKKVLSGDDDTFSPLPFSLLFLMLVDADAVLDAVFSLLRQEVDLFPLFT